MLGGGAGTIADMIIRYRNNMNLLRRTRYFKRESDYLRIRKNYKKAAKNNFSFRTATKEEMAAIRKKVVDQQKIENIQLWFALIVLLGALGFFLFHLGKIILFS